MDIEPREAGTSRSILSSSSHNRAPARNPVTPSGRGFRAKFFSPKNQRLIRCESLLEFDCLHLFEFARGVTSFVEQPKTIRYQLRGRSRTYTPDFAVDWADGQRWLVEVKPADILQAPANREKFERLAEVFGNQQEKFVILCDEQIRNTVRLKQIKHLLRIRYENWLDGTVDAVAPSSMENRTIAQVLNAGASGRAILHRLASREIVCSLDEEITGTTRLRAFEERDDAILFL